MSIEFSSVHALSEQLAQGQVTARQIVSVFLERIARHNPKLHAFVTDYRDEALSLADDADAQFAAGHRVSALQGIPIAIKDIIDMQGRVTTGGSRVWSHRVCRHDSAGRHRRVRERLQPASPPDPPWAVDQRNRATRF